LSAHKSANRIEFHTAETFQHWLMRTIIWHGLRWEWSATLFYPHITLLRHTQIPNTLFKQKSHPQNWVTMRTARVWGAFPLARLR